MLQSPNVNVAVDANAPLDVALEGARIVTLLTRQYSRNEERSSSDIEGDDISIKAIHGQSIVASAMQGVHRNHDATIAKDVIAM